MTKSVEATGRLWVEEGSSREGMVAGVAPLIPVYRLYSFAVPADREAEVLIGRRVRVPIGRGRRLVEGYVVSLDRRSWDSTLEPVAGVLDDESFLSPELLRLGEFIAAHYCCPLGLTLKAMTPSSVRRGAGLRRVRYIERIGDAERLASSEVRLTVPRRRVIEALSAREAGPRRLDEVVDEAGVSRAVIQGLEKAGLVSVTERREIVDDATAHPPPTEPEFELNDEQRAALDHVLVATDAGEFSVTLIHGVSGSGKTEIYIRAMQRVIASGKQAIFLVPEIVLTTQLVSRISCRFSRIAVAHSGLTDAKRAVMWRRAAGGEIDVVIGTRSAVFAPCPNLGLICVDEEQETSFKNLRAPRFHVRDVAIMRGHLAGFPVVLGSATPSLESWHNSETRPAYRRVSLRRRVEDRPLPDVHVVDMRDEYRMAGRTVLFSRLLQRSLEEAFSRNEQAVLLLNRRGYASRLHCPKCGVGVRCSECMIGMVVHLARGEAMCHYCRKRMPTPRTCPTLGCGTRLELIGAGTQRVEEVMKKLFPSARVTRVDSDTMRHQRDYQRVVSQFERREMDVLVGTQMVAKGLDFPHVSVVGVVDADIGATAIDFRAQEHLFQLITQVAGRAGRGASPGTPAGRAVVQTMMPDSPALQHAVNHDYEAFAEAELRSRKRTAWPPYHRLARFVVAHPREETAAREAEGLAERMREAAKSPDHESSVTCVIGPNPCPLARLRGRYRYDVLVKATTATALRSLIGAVRDAGGLRTKAEVMTLDVDPVSLS